MREIYPNNACFYLLYVHVPKQYTFQTIKAFIFFYIERKLYVTDKTNFMICRHNNIVQITFNN